MPVVSTGRPHRVVATAGHVDHGKSTLLHRLTGMDPVRLDEERRRGLTIDLGFVWATLTTDDGVDVDVAFVDVPGHERFVATMLAGAGAVSGVLFVVAADDGWSAQSSEHRDALDLLDIPAVGIVITKCDLVGAERVAAVYGEIEQQLSGTSLEGAPVLETSASDDAAIARIGAVIAAQVAGMNDAEDRARPRLWIDRSFTMPGAGTIVTGTLAGGSLALGQAARLLPQHRDVRVRGLQALGDVIDHAAPGQRVAVNLAGIDHDDVTRGDVLVAGGPWRMTRGADVWIRSVRADEITRSGSWVMHIGTRRVRCRVTPLDGPIGGSTRPDSGPARLALAEPVPLVAGDRFVLRDTGRRIIGAGGVVADPRVASWRRRTRSDERLALIEALATAAPEERPALLLQLAGGAADIGDFYAAAGFHQDAHPPSGSLSIGGHVVATSTFNTWVDDVRDIGPGTHAREEIAAHARRAGVPAGLDSRLVDALEQQGVLARAPGGWTLAEHVDEAHSQQQARAAALLRDLAANPFAPPELTELARTHGVDHRELAALVQRGDIVRSGRVTFARQTIELAEQRLRAAGLDERTFTAAEAKDAWDTTRKYAIPLLEHLDRTGVTRFDGQLRTLRDRPVERT